MALSTNLESLIEALEYVRTHPRLYFLDSAQAAAFMSGIAFASSTFGFVKNYTQEYRKVTQERGWKETPQHIKEQMKEKGLAEWDIVDELIAIEIEIYQRQKATPT